MTVYPLADLLGPRGDDEVSEICTHWTGNGALRGGRTASLAALRAAMSDEQRVAERVKALPKRLADLLESYLREPGYVRGLRSALSDKRLGFQSQYEIEAALAALGRQGFLLPATGKSWAAAGETAHAIPLEIAVALESSRRRDDRGLLDTFTLKGFIEKKHFNTATAAGRGEPDQIRTSVHARQAYKLLIQPEPMLARVTRLPERTRMLVDRAMRDFGGLMPKDLFAKVDGGETEFDTDLVRHDLEEALVGTVADLSLSRFGVRSASSVLVVFNEITLVHFQQNGSVAAPDEEVRGEGVDLASNASRFLRFVEDHAVRFTLKGEIFRNTEKKLLEKLILNPGREVDADEVLQFVFGFATSRRLLDRSGERTFKMSPAGLEFEHKDLGGKLHDLLGYAIEERGLPGEHFHQVRLRRIFMRLLRRVDPGTWYDAMYMPFLARNSYLSQLDSLAVEEFFESRFHSGEYSPSEDLQQLCWNLFTWVKRRLHLLGIVDLGYRSGRACAMRVSDLGAQLLGAVPAAKSGGTRSTLVVNPDFEIIVFPETDAHDLVHSLDRFCQRTKSDRLYHFRLSEETVRAGLADGMTISEIVDLLTRRSRAPLPQNVLFSLRDWGDKAGVVVVEKVWLATARRSELMDRFVELPQVKAHVVRRLSPTTVALRGSTALAKISGVLRELGFFVESGKPG